MPRSSLPAVEPGTVCALVDATVALREDVDHVVRHAAGDMAAGIAAALATDAEWTWLLSGPIAPQDGALEAFRAALVALDDLPAPLVLAGRVLDAHGALHLDAAPRHEIFEKQLSVEAAARGLVQLRAAPAGSLLIRRAAFERFTWPRADLPPRWAVFDFTARVLRAREDTGYLVPASTALRDAPPRGGGRGRGLRSRARVATGPAWNGTERLWEGFLVGQELLRGAPGRAPRGAGRHGDPAR